MPLGYWFGVLLIAWAVTCALTCWRHLRPLVTVPALLANEVPFIIGYLLAASTVLALVQGDLDSAGGVAAAGVALLDFVGLGVIVRRAMQADAALHNEIADRPWGRILRAPLFPARRDVVRVRGVPYGSGDDPQRVLDVFVRRDQPDGVPVLVHFHGGGFSTGNEHREARPLMGYLTSRRGFVCISARYRLQPDVALEDQVDDVRAVLAWTRAHAAEYGGRPDRLFVTGSSAGANLAIRAVCAGESGIAGMICRYGYYGDLEPPATMPPLLVVHGEHDLQVPAAGVREFADSARAASRNPVRYAELPGAHHDFDLFESIRAAAVNTAVARFADQFGTG